MTQSTITQSARIHAYFQDEARSKNSAHPVAPFTLFLHATDKSENANYAIPDGPVDEDVSEAMGEIERVCTAHECHAHIRYMRAIAPELPRLLEEAGYAVSESKPLLTCSATTLIPAAPVPGLQMVTVSKESSLADLKEGLDANALGFDIFAPAAADQDAEAFRAILQDNLAFTARLQGQAVGAGMYNPIRDGVGEVVGITTLPPFRRRGIAAYLTHFATQAAFDHGAELVFLVADHAEAQRVYERIGYRYHCDLLNHRAAR